MSQRSRSMRGLRIVAASSGSQEQVEDDQQTNEQPNLEASQNDLLEMIDETGHRFKKRRKTVMANIWNMDLNEKIYVEVDEFGTPWTKEAAALSSFLRVIAKNGKLAPISIGKWNDKEFKTFKKNMLDIIKQKFSYPETKATDDWILKSLNKKWRDHKGDLKQENYDLSKTIDEIISNVPEGVIEEQWPSLVNSWFTEKSQKISAINKVNAKTKKNAHTSGRKSFARKRKEMIDKTGQVPDRLTLFEETHKRKDGTYVDDEVRQLIEKAHALIRERSQDPSFHSSELNEQVFQEVMGLEHNGRVRGVGLGPAPTSYFGGKRARCAPSNSAQSKEIEMLEKQLEEVTGKYDSMEETLNGLKEWISKTFSSALKANESPATNLPPTSSEYTNPNASVLPCFLTYDTRSKKSVHVSEISEDENDEISANENDEISANENDDLEVHSSGKSSAPDQAESYNVLQTLSRRQTITGSRTRGCGDIPSNVVQNGNSSVYNAVSNEHTLSLEPEIASNLAGEQEGQILNHHLVGKQLNRTLSFGLTELVGMSGDNNDSKIDEAQSLAYVQISGYNVKLAFEPMVRSIITKHGDIAEKFYMKTPEARSLALENIAEVIQGLKTKKCFEIPQHEIEKAIALVNDFRTAGMDVGWLHGRLKEMMDAKLLIAESSTLKERSDKSYEIMKERGREVQMLQEKLDLAKENFAKAQAEAEAVRELVSNGMSKVSYFVNHSPFDGLL